MENLTITNYRGKSKLNFSSHKDCRKFINGNIDLLHLSMFQSSWLSWHLYQSKSNHVAIKVGKILKIRSQSIVMDSYERISLREYNLEKILQ